MKIITDTKTRIVEIFSSIQGEGLHIGERHIFVRFKDCNLNCCYCDEIHNSSYLLSTDHVLEKIQYLERNNGPHSYVSLTGGEPLCHIDFLEILCPKVCDKGLNIFLETNGTLYIELKKIIHLISVTSMDIKLKSVWEIEDCYKSHNDFLHVLEGYNFYIKMIISHNVDIEEYLKYIKLIYKFNNTIPLILQPLTPSYGHNKINLYSILFELQEIALQKLINVRVIPQLHKIINLK